MNNCTVHIVKPRQVDPSNAISYDPTRTTFVGYRSAGKVAIPRKFRGKK